MISGETKIKIVDHLRRFGPRTLGELAKALHMPRQKVHYNLTQLMKEGVILRTEDSKYSLQPIFYGESADLYFKLINLMTDMLDYLIIHDDVDPTTAMIANFEYYMLVNLSEFDLIKRKVGDRNAIQEKDFV